MHGGRGFPIKHFKLRHKNKLIRRSLSGVFLLLIGWLLIPPILFQQTPHSLVIEDHEGGILAVGLAKDGQWRYPIGAKVSDKYFVALQAFEDQQFYQHPGVNVFALCRAFYHNLSGNKRQGGSTISMQLARRSLGMKKRTVYAKLLEILLAFKIELWKNKEEILLNYAVHAPFGGNVVGVEAACQRFLGYSPDRISWADACLLAILPNKPSSLIPGRNNPVLIKRRNNLLLRLWRMGKLSAQDYELAIQEPLPLRWRNIPNVTPHLLSTNKTKFPLGGRLKTDINSLVQVQVQAIVNRYCERLSPNGVTQAAALVIDLQRGKLISYVGNRTDRRHLNADGDDFDMVQQPRSYGSLLKPFLMAYALEQGVATPTRLMPDYDLNFQGYSPQNYDRKYQGAMKLQDALAKSQNVPFVYLLKELGTAPFLSFLRKSGLTSLTKAPSFYGLSLILGGTELSLWELAKVYSGFASNDRIKKSKSITSGMMASLSLNWEFKSLPLSDWSIYHTIQAMKEVERPGLENNWRMFARARPFAWKTGTSFGYRDAWSIGFDSRFLVAVWTGNARNLSCAGLTGISTAAPLMFDIRSRLPQANFNPPPQSGAYKQEICVLSGLASSQDCPKTTWLAPQKDSRLAVCPWHKKIFLTHDGRFRVHDQCPGFADAHSVVWWSLSPSMAYYYKINHPEYQLPPPFSPLCPKSGRESQLQLVYPETGQVIHLEQTEHNSNSNNAMFVAKAIHLNPSSKVFWYSNGNLVKITIGSHEILLKPKEGLNQLSIHDIEGNSASIHYTVSSHFANK